MGVWYGIDDERVAEYNQRMVKLSPFVDAVLAKGSHRAHGPGSMVVPRSELVGTEFFDWMLRSGADDSLAAIDIGADTGIISLAGYAEVGRPINDEQLDIIGAVHPHMFHAIALSRQFARLEFEARPSRQALSKADFGCAIMDARGRLDWLNDTARRLLERDDAMEIVDGRLRARHPAARPGLESAIRSALGVEWSDDDPASEPEFIFKLPRIGGGHPIEILVSPLRPLGHPLFGELHGALVLFSDTEHLDEGIAGRLEQLYELTPTEAEVAQWLMAGSSTNEIADIFGNSIHTIRTHVKRILTKCGASSQVELVGLLQRSLVRLA